MNCKFKELTESQRKEILKQHEYIIECSCCEGIMLPIPDMISFRKDEQELLVYPVTKCMNKNCNEKSYSAGRMIKVCKKAKELYKKTGQKEFNYNELINGGNKND